MVKVGAPTKRGEETAPFNIRATGTVHRFAGTIMKIHGGNRTDALHWIIMAVKDGGPAELRCIDLARQLDERDRTIAIANRNFEKVILERDEWKSRYKHAVGKWGDLWKKVRRHLPRDILERVLAKATGLGIETNESREAACRTCAEREATEVLGRYRDAKEAEQLAS